jgi:T-complex protein 1 subunit gamma
MFNKDVTHSRMRRKIENPRILLLDCNLEYKKAESQMGIEVSNPDHWTTILKQEEDYIAQMCADIIKHKPGTLDLPVHKFTSYLFRCCRHRKGLV